MKSAFATAIGLTAVLGSALLAPATGVATPGTSPAGPCTPHSGANTFPIKLTVNAQGAPSVDPATNENGTCVQGGDTVSVDTSSLPSGATWSFTFKQNVNLFQSGCQLGNGSGQESGCKVVSSPPPYTYQYQATVNGNSMDPKIIVKGNATSAAKEFSIDHLIAAFASGPR